ncbi:hypothetical protein [Natronobeatus ordinarius]|uniref:hypothetical protein n=1 Tax=Natronobeatus ordinarius TaxID=2963433 RepID=UPI0020CD0343|nr:hypothetical protein [Natronobeatus ordinarius]
MDSLEIEREADLTTFHGDRFGIDLQVDCPHDSEQWVTTTGGVDSSELPNLTKSQKGAIAEEEAGPQFLEDRGLEIEYLDDAQTPGFDIVAYDNTADEYHIIEAKFKSDSGNVSNSSAWFDRPDKGPQMTNEWVDATIEEMIDSGNEDLTQLGEELERARIDGRTNDELVIVQNDEQNELTVLETLVEGDMDIDRVHLVKLEEVIE